MISPDPLRKKNKNPYSRKRRDIFDEIEIEFNALMELEQSDESDGFTEKGYTGLVKPNSKSRLNTRLRYSIF